MLSNTRLTLRRYLSNLVPVIPLRTIGGIREHAPLPTNHWAEDFLRRELRQAVRRSVNDAN